LTDLVRIVEGRDRSDPQLMKPHPNVLLRTLRDLNAPAESAAIVGDSIADIEAGLAADVWTIGYANKPGKDEAMREAGADVVLDSMPNSRRRPSGHLSGLLILEPHPEPA